MTEWHSDGTKKLEGMCRKNKRIGSWKQYDQYGNDHVVTFKETKKYSFSDCCGLLRTLFVYEC